MSSPPIENTEPADPLAQHLPFCGGCHAPIPINAIRCCSSCKIRAYCNAGCQAIDWPMHKKFCLENNPHQERQQLVRAYDRKFNNHLISIALNQLGFPAYSTVPPNRRLDFLPITQGAFLRVRLQTVLNPAPGRWNRVSFLSAELAEMSSLPAATAVAIQSRLEDRFPAVCIGYTIHPVIFDADAERTVTTITHPFVWPNPGNGYSVSIPEERLRQSILTQQDALVTQAIQEQAARRRI